MINCDNVSSAEMYFLTEAAINGTMQNKTKRYAYADMEKHDMWWYKKIPMIPTMKNNENN